MSVSKLLHSAKGKLYINGAPYALVTDISWSISPVVQELEGLDFPLPFELAPGAIRISLQLGLLRSIGSGGTQGAGLSVDIDGASRQQYVTVLLIERQTKQVMFKSDYCMSSGESWSLPEKGVSRGSITLKAIGYANEYST